MPRNKMSKHFSHWTKCYTLSCDWCYTFTQVPLSYWGHRGPDRIHMVVGFTNTYAISGNHHWCCEFESRSWWGMQHYVIKFVSGLPPGPPVSSINKTDRHDINEILLKVALNTIKQTKLYHILSCNVGHCGFLA